MWYIKPAHNHYLPIITPFIIYIVFRFFDVPSTSMELVNVIKLVDEENCACKYSNPTGAKKCERCESGKSLLHRGDLRGLKTPTWNTWHDYACTRGLVVLDLQDIAILSVSIISPKSTNYISINFISLTFQSPIIIMAVIVIILVNTELCGAKGCTYNNQQSNSKQFPTCILGL